MEKVQSNNKSHFHPRRQQIYKYIDIDIIYIYNDIIYVIYCLPGYICYDLYIYVYLYV